MSQEFIHQYLNELSDLKRFSGSNRETVIREAFKTLLKNMGKSRDLIFIPEYLYETTNRHRRYIDGALVYEVRVPFGYWEAKDNKDNLDDEIEYKFRRGYPQDNIIFEDSQEAILIQNKNAVMRCKVDSVENLERLLGNFFQYERKEIAQFRKAVEQFKSDLPAVLTALRGMIEKSLAENSDFNRAAGRFLRHARETINPSVTDADVREMLIQHILTEDIFGKVFSHGEFHRQNNVAKELYALEETFFIGGLKWKTLKGLESYYSAIRSAAAKISNHHEKQTFLKVIYENFYKIYNKKAADRLGVVYTPSEIVQFMVKGTDWLCEKKFGKNLIDKNVEILEPAAGTGTFVTELIEHFRGQPAKLREKYKEELHANELAILPYYVANLNIEATYAAIAGEYEEFPNLCFVDTLDSIAGLGRFSGQQEELFGALSQENYVRINRQNKRKISIVIGNPPYNANQQSENENNKNRKYPTIDGRIKNTYIASSTAQKTKLYDMYVRFFRWASDRVQEKGIIAFITNRSFLDARNFDGFRKVVRDEFSEAFIVDLGGDWKKQGAAGSGNVFGIGTGVAIGFWIKDTSVKNRGQVKYFSVPRGTGEEKKAWLDANKLSEIEFALIPSEADEYWINLPTANFGTALPLASKDVKSSKRGGDDRAIFKLFTLGISTNRDDWLYDRQRKGLEAKAAHFTARYNQIKPNTKEFPEDIKWSETLKRRKRAGVEEPFDSSLIRSAAYRPFVNVWLYQSPLFIDRPGLSETMFPRGKQNVAICFSDVGSRANYCVLAVDKIADLHFGASVDGYQQVARYHYANGKRDDNITDWALAQFRNHYPSITPVITKDAIFAYVYAVLFDPKYRKTFEINLRREFPRIPFYADFWKWAGWGSRLMKLHLSYESLEPWRLKRLDTKDVASREAGLKPKAILKVDKENGTIRLNGETQLTGVPSEAWRFQLGNRSALEWILDQYSERSIRDPVVAARFDTYKFSKNKTKVIDLIERITRVSVETVDIVSEMAAMKR
jgi:predicted helicase